MAHSAQGFISQPKHLARCKSPKSAWPGRGSAWEIRVWLEDRACAHSCTCLEGVQSQTPAPKSCCPEENSKPRPELDVLAPQFTCSLLNRTKLQVEVVFLYFWCETICVGFRILQDSQSRSPQQQRKTLKGPGAGRKTQPCTCVRLKCILSVLTQINCRAL